MTWRANVFAIVSRIPPGRVMTYRDVAGAIGSPRAARAVGNALNTNRDTQAVPCHRVVRADGAVGGYAFGVNAKIKKLQAEGVSIEEGRVVHIATVIWRPD